MNETVQSSRRQGSPVEVFLVFLKLGLVSFGGPVAHLGYFRDELVTRRGWLSEQAYGDLVALCQFLPGPASSQTGFALGLIRAGWLGALAAFLAFTLPSALLLFGFAQSVGSLAGPVATGATHGLKIVAVAIVFQAVWGMAKAFCTDPARAGIAVAAVAMLAFVPGTFGMTGAIALGGFAGFLLGRGAGAPAGGRIGLPVSRGQGVAALSVFLALLVLLPLVSGQSTVLAILDGFYRAGALVFGGGHVVLPLLQAEVVGPGWVSEDAFLSGYGAAQAVPGPLFTFAAYLGALLEPAPNAVAGALLALLAVFLPGFLVLIAVLPFWDRLRALSWAQSVLQGTNAAVVGILGTALYSPVFTSAVGDVRDLLLALVCVLALMPWKLPPWTVVLIAATGGVGLEFASGF
jgi:chromate transporter